MPDLNPYQFFHGTTHDIKDGMVRPANATDKSVSEYSYGDPGNMSGGDHAFAARNDETYAWHAAHTFHPGVGRARVYEVDPAKDMKPGPWNKEHPDFLAHHELDDPDDYDDPSGEETAGLREEVDRAHERHQDEWASKTGFPVRKRIDIMPGRQGTFHQVNWNQFLGKATRGVEANHPNHMEARMGVDHQMHHEEALRLNAVYDKSKEPEPKRRSGASFRAFMEGKPEPPPESDPTLF